MEHRVVTGKGIWLMPKQSKAVAAVAGQGLPSGISLEDTADALIGEEFAGDPRAAVIALLDLVHALGEEILVLRRAASPGFARRPSIGIAGAS